MADRNDLQKKNPLWARVVLGIIVFLLAAGLVVALGWTIFYPLKGFEKKFGQIVVQVNEAMIMFFAGGVGSGLYTIRAYLLHACEKKDLDPGYIPWYPFRIFQGALLGLIFYFALRGGLLFLTINGKDAAIDVLNSWSLAGIGSLVGLFSKYALEKLREVFLTMFSERTEESSKLDAILKALPEEIQKKVAKSLKSEGSEE